MTIGIIEPVGGHRGMDYYDYGLSYGLAQNDVVVRYYTCDETEIRHYNNVTTIICFKRMWDHNFFIKSFRYIKGHFVAFRDLKRQHSGIAHLHFFTFRSIDLLCLLIGRIMGLKMVVTIHDINAFDKSGNSSIENLCYKLINVAIVHNKFSYDALVSKLTIKIPVEIIPHGNYIPFINQVENSYHQHTGFNLLFFGQIKEVKGVDLLLKAVAIVKNKGYDVKLTLAGKPWKTDEAFYLQLIESLNITDIVQTDLRYVPDDEVAPFYANADLIVLPYKEIYQSGALLLAMSYNKPVLTSDLEAFTDVIIHQKNGLVFKNQSIEDLSDKIIYAIENKASLREFVAEATKIIESRFDWINIGRLTKRVYQECQSSTR